MMDEDLRQRKVREIKEQCLSGARVLEDNSVKNLVDESIVKSWLNSSSLGLNRFCDVLSPASSDRSTLRRIPDFMLYSLKENDFYYRSKHELLERLGIALLYIDSHLSVMHTVGNPALLEELKRKNIKFGTVFTEESIGTNAVPFAVHSKKVHVIVGEEHFLEILTPYTTAAFSFYHGGLEENEFVVNCYVVQMAKYSKTLNTLFNFIFSSELQRSILLQPKEGELKNAVINYNLQQHTHLIILDINGIIIDINDALKDEIQHTAQLIVGRPLKSVFPELEIALSVLVTFEPLSMVNVRLSTNKAMHNTRDYYMNCSLVKSKGDYIGMIISLIEKDRTASLLSNNAKNKKKSFAFNDIVGDDPDFLAVKSQAEKAANSMSNVLILGESGTGKELFAQAIHYASHRSNKPFVALNCAAIPSSLIESELFGYSEGAFTGAKKSGNPGKFELANGGTIFLDEIAEMPLPLQGVLLRILEERKIVRLGSTKTIDLDIRIIAATNCDLQQHIKEGRFRLDLFYRFNVFKIELPPLRYRQADIPLLAHVFLEKFATATDKNITTISQDALICLKEYFWPGNIRELRNVIEYAVNVAEPPMIRLQDLPSELRIVVRKADAKVDKIAVTLPPDYERIVEPDEFDSYDDYEREQVKVLLRKHHGNKSFVAKEMNIARTTLYRKMRKHGIH